MALRDLAAVVIITFISTLPGVLPLISEQAAANAASPENWEFIVRTHMPFHFDPFYFSGVGMGGLAVMLAFNLVILWQSDSFRLRFIRNFQMVIAAFFLLGVVWRFYEVYPALRFMPMRLFPLLTPLFFLFCGFYLLRQTQHAPVRIAAAAVMVLTFGMLHPIDEAIGQMRETKASWVTSPDDLERSLMWISQNTPQDALILAAPNNRKIYYLSQRAQIMSYSYPRYERLAEWFERLGELTGSANIPDRASSRAAIESGFERLTPEQITQLKEKHAATHLLTRAEYDFPVIFESGSYKIYSLP